MHDNKPGLQLKHVALSDLLENPKRTRKHSSQKLRMVQKSILEMGQVDVPIVDEGLMILSGHLRVQAHAACGDTHIYVVQVSHLDPEQKLAFSISSNKLPQLGSWDDAALKDAMQILTDLDCDIDLDLTGFEVGEIDFLLLDNEDVHDDEPEIPELPKQPTSRPGDVFQLGCHRLICGDSLEELTWQRLMQDEKAAGCFTDPPYNVPNKGHVTSKDHPDFAMAAGEMSEEEFTGFLFRALDLAAQFSFDGALHYVCMDHRHLRELYSACDQVYSSQLNLIVWNKTNAGMGSFYRSRHELISLFKVGNAKHVNNVQLGKHGRNRSNVWTYPGANTFRSGRDKDLSDHPTVKPVAMVADAILDSTNPGDIVVDGFGGSGTLILAAEQTGRRARVVEYEPGYCDVTIQRWEEMTGEKALLIASKQPFDDSPQKPAPMFGGFHV